MINKSRTPPMLKWRRTKIIATLGPSSDSEKMIAKLIQAGVNVFRLNMSHGEPESHQRVSRRIRAIASKMKAHVAILIDLCGPKIRVGQFVGGGITLKQNTSVIIRCGGRTDSDVITSQYKNLYKDVNPGERILLDDGNIELKVEKVTGKDIVCKVIYGGLLKDHKGMNLPDSVVSVTSFTTKDKEDVRLAIKLAADFVALSFVREGKDIRKLKNFMKKIGQEIPVISKIEKPEAVKNIDEIIQLSYGIMIARGDLGIELPAEQVPLIQRSVINKARFWHRPVIVATQMMESMVENARPTRAEVGDVANAALSSADAVMLSAETAVGKYPYRTVKTMDAVLREIEHHQWVMHKFVTDNSEDIFEQTDRERIPSTRKAVAHAARSLVQELDLKGLLVPTNSGVTANILSSVRPSAPLFGLSANLVVCRKLAIHWGVVPLLINEVEARDWQKLVSKICRQCHLTRAGNKVLLVSGFHDNPGISQPVLKIMTV